MKYPISTNENRKDKKERKFTKMKINGQYKCNMCITNFQKLKPT